MEATLKNTKLEQSLLALEKQERRAFLQFLQSSFFNKISVIQSITLRFSRFYRTLPSTSISNRFIVVVYFLHAFFLTDIYFLYCQLTFPTAITIKILLNKIQLSVLSSAEF